MELSQDGKGSRSPDGTVGEGNTGSNGFERVRTVILGVREKSLVHMPNV